MITFKVNAYTAPLEVNILDDTDAAILLVRQFNFDVGEAKEIVKLFNCLDNIFLEDLDTFTLPRNYEYSDVIRLTAFTIPELKNSLLKLDTNEQYIITEFGLDFYKNYYMLRVVALKNYKLSGEAIAFVRNFYLDKLDLSE